jgi:ubiquinone/menaquinone biosynthesis C-methylase UbiE
VLDLGCGFGWFCRWAREQGVAQVLGVDVSARMLARARATTDDPAITYSQADLEHLQLSPGSFDLAFSSLTLHYLQGLHRLLAEVQRALVTGGRLVFSVEHPIYTAPTDPKWYVDALRRKTWPVDAYLAEGIRITDWLTKGVIKQHRTLASYVNVLLKCSFTIARIEEWGPTEAQIAARPSLAEERQRPPFLLVAADRL